MKKIVTVPNAVLRQVAVPIEKVDAKLFDIIKQLGQTLLATRNPRGVGLAAPQIGSSIRLFTSWLSDTNDPRFLRHYINPRIIDASDKLVTGPNHHRPDLEGCLSIPLLYGPVLRPEWVTIEFQTLEENELVIHAETFFDFNGRVIQHEIDHLDGILFTDHTRAQNQPLYEQRGDDMIAVDADFTGGW